MPLPPLGVFAKRKVAAAPPILTNIISYYDFSNASSITLVSGAVSQINDLSGNGRHLTQTTAANRPTIATADQNGLDTGVFDGSNDYLNCAAFSLSTTAASIYAVFKYGGTADKVLLTFGEDSNGKLRTFYSNTGGNMENGTYNGGSNSVRSSNQTGYNAWAHINAATGTTPFTELFNATRNANIGFAGGNLNAITNPYIGLGGANFGYNANIRIGEVLFYSTEHNTTDQDSIMSYLKTKWGTP